MRALLFVLGVVGYLESGATRCRLIAIAASFQRALLIRQGSILLVHTRRSTECYRNEWPPCHHNGMKNVARQGKLPVGQLAKLAVGLVRIVAKYG